MEHRELRKIIQQVVGILKVLQCSVVLMLIVSLLLYSSVLSRLIPEKEELFAKKQLEEVFADGFHTETGLIEGNGVELVVQNCTSCHSAQLIMQNRMSKNSWAQTIKWMQDTQNLWDLEENHEAILLYLSTHYAPQKKGRRQNLEITEWYELD